MSYSDNKPECYGDEDYYDPDDKSCKDCGVFNSCGIRASRAARAGATTGSRSYTRPQTTTPASNTAHTRTTQTTAAAKIKRTEVEPDENASFGGILLHNTGLEVLQTVVDELGNSIRQIPRIDYGTYFERRKK